MALTTTTGAGLEGVVAGESEICFIDGDEGILSYRGYNIHTLAENAKFEEVIFLLWNGRLPRRDELEPVEIGPGAKPCHPQTGAGFSGHGWQIRADGCAADGCFYAEPYDPIAGDMAPEANALKAVKLMAQTATIVSTFRPPAQPTAR